MPQPQRYGGRSARAAERIPKHQIYHHGVVLSAFADIKLWQNCSLLAEYENQNNAPFINQFTATEVVFDNLLQKNIFMYF
jgi:hypothetical protein